MKQEYRDAYDEYMNMLEKEAEEISKKYECTKTCAYNVQYLRTRSRWTLELEKELVRLDREEDYQPNICEWP